MWARTREELQASRVSAGAQGRRTPLRAGRAAAAALLSAGIAVADPPSAAEREACRRLLESAAAPVAGALRHFEATRPDGNEALVAARDVLAAATAARDKLEAVRVSAFCAPSRGEELIYFNHLTLGFGGWIAARSRRPPAAYDVGSIVRRARVHQSRGRARLE